MIGFFLLKRKMCRQHFGNLCRVSPLMKFANAFFEILYTALTFNFVNVATVLKAAFSKS